jgi:hypothetical protein
MIAADLLLVVLSFVLVLVGCIRLATAVRTDVADEG